MALNSRCRELEAGGEPRVNEVFGYLNPLRLLAYCPLIITNPAFQHMYHLTQRLLILGVVSRSFIVSKIYSRLPSQESNKMNPWYTTLPVHSALLNAKTLTAFLHHDIQ